MTNVSMLIFFTTMKIAVVGCGGIGGMVAGVLGVNGHDFVLIEASREYADILSRNGIRLTGKKGEIKTSVKAYSGFKDAGLKYDLIIMAVKSVALRSVFEESRKFLTPSGFILTLQNGLEPLRLCEEHPEARVVGGAVGYNSIMDKYGLYHVTSQGGITVGNLINCSHSDLASLKELFSPGIKISFTDNIRGVLWAKLLIVCGITGLGGISGKRIGKLMKLGVARKLFYHVVTEGYCVAKKLGIKMEKFGGLLPEKFGVHKGSHPVFFRYLALRIVGRKYRELKSNIHQSIEKGQRTEVDYLNGEIVRRGEDAGVPTPVNEAVVRIVKEIEEKKRNMGIENLEELWRMIPAWK